MTHRPILVQGAVVGDLWFIIITCDSASEHLPSIGGKALVGGIWKTANNNYILMFG